MTILRDILKPTINIYLKSYDPKQESRGIIYLDTNNLHVYAMPKFIPTDWFEWTDPKEFDSNKHSSNTLKGYILEVDHKYPKELQELHNECVLL